MPNNDDTQQQTPREGQVIVSSDPDTMGQRAVYTKGQWQVIKGPSSQSQGGGPSPLAQYQFFQQQHVQGVTPQEAQKQFYLLNPNLRPKTEAESAPPPGFFSRFQEGQPLRGILNEQTWQHPLQSLENVAKGLQPPTLRSAGSLRGPMQAIGAMTGAPPFLFSARPAEIAAQKTEPAHGLEDLRNRNFAAFSGDAAAGLANAGLALVGVRGTEPTMEAYQSTLPLGYGPPPERIRLGPVPGERGEPIQGLTPKGAEVTYPSAGPGTSRSPVSLLRRPSAPAAMPVMKNEVEDMVLEGGERLKQSISDRVAASTLDPNSQSYQNLVNDPTYLDLFSPKGRGNLKVVRINDVLESSPAEVRRMGKLLTEATGDPSMERDLGQWSSLLAGSKRFSGSALRRYGISATPLATAGYFAGHALGGWVGGAAGAMVGGGAATVVERLWNYVNMSSSPFTRGPSAEEFLEPYRNLRPPAPQTPFRVPPMPPAPQTPTAPTGAGPLALRPRPPQSPEMMPTVRATVSNLRNTLSRLKPQEQQALLAGVEEGMKDGSKAAQDIVPNFSKAQDQALRDAMSEAHGENAAGQMLKNVTPEQKARLMKQYNIGPGKVAGRSAATMDNLRDYLMETYGERLGPIQWSLAQKNDAIRQSLINEMRGSR